MTDVQVFMAVSIKGQVFRFLTSCSLINIYRGFVRALFIQQFQAVRKEKIS